MDIERRYFVRALRFQRVVSLIIFAVLAAIVWNQSRKLEAATKLNEQQTALVAELANTQGAMRYAVYRTTEDLSTCRSANNTLAQIDRWLADELRDHHGSTPPCLQASNSTP